TSACKGVLVRTRRMLHTVRSGASNVVAEGYGALRRQRVYRARRQRSSPWLGCQSVELPNAAASPKLGRGGCTGGPYIVLPTSRPTNSAGSGIASADSRGRGPRASRRLNGSRLSPSDGLPIRPARDDWR